MGGKRSSLSKLSGENLVEKSNYRKANEKELMEQSQLRVVVERREE